MYMWKDITSYSRGDTERKPRVLECQLTPNIKFVVHKHIHCGNEWFLSSDFVGLRLVGLDTTDMEEAKEKGTEIMVQKLKEKKEEVDQACQILSNARDSLVG